MRRGFVFLSLVASSLALGSALTAGACSSTSAAPPPPDGAPTQGALGEPCSSSLPCEPLTDVCSASVCDATSHLCVRIAVDAGPICTGGSGPTLTCTSSPCDGGEDEGGAAEAGVAEGGDAGDSSVDAADGSPDSESDGAAVDAAGDASADAPIEAGAGDGGGD